MQYLKFTLLAMIGIALLAGCQWSQNAAENVSGQFTNPVQRAGQNPPAPLSQDPLIVDQAMQIREWNRSTATYANGDTNAGPTGFRYELNRDQDNWRHAAFDAPLFIVQTLGLPVTMTMKPPWSRERYAGVNVEGTYTAMPPLPPMQERMNETPEIESTPPSGAGSMQRSSDSPSGGTSGGGSSGAGSSGGSSGGGGGAQ